MLYEFSRYRNNANDENSKRIGMLESSKLVMTHSIRQFLPAYMPVFAMPPSDQILKTMTYGHTDTYSIGNSQYVAFLVLKDDMTDVIEVIDTRRFRL